jgi:hypothetical protein
MKNQHKKVVTKLDLEINHTVDVYYVDLALLFLFQIYLIISDPNSEGFASGKKKLYHDRYASFLASCLLGYGSNTLPIIFY